MNSSKRTVLLNWLRSIKGQQTDMTVREVVEEELKRQEGEVNDN